MFDLSLSCKRVFSALLLVVAVSFYPRLLVSQGADESSRIAMPVVFEPNRGQAPSWARYIARTVEGVVILASDRIEITPSGASGSQNFELRFEGANPQVFQEEASGDGTANYYFGGQSLRRIEQVPLYRKVRYGQLYPGIDLLFHGKAGRLEYDFELAPHTTAEPLRIELTDAEQAEARDDGTLVISQKGSSIRLLPPHAFQHQGDGTVRVDVAYRLLGRHQVGFRLGTYDQTRPLVIDPVVSYAETIYAGNSTSAAAVAADSKGNLIFTGSTFSTTYPVINGQLPDPMASEEVYVTKFDPTGENIVYSTYLPAFGFSTPSALAVDQGGDAFIAGITGDAGFPVTSHNLGACGLFCNAGFVTKLDPSGALLYSTLLGSGQILPKALAIDANGNALVSGLAADGSLQTVNAFQAAYEGGLCTSCYSGFFAKLNDTGTGFIFSSYLGAGNNATGLALDGLGNMYVAGPADNVYGATIPLKGELQSGFGAYFLTKFAPDGKNLLFGTFLGGYPSGNSRESLAGVRVGTDGTVYLGGSTASDGFPYTLDAYRHPTGVTSNARMFAMALDPSLTKLKYSTDLGGGFMSAMTIDAAGNFYAAAATGADPIQPLNAVVADVTSGGFFLELDPSGVPVQTSAFGGQLDDEAPVGIALDLAGNIYIAGITGGSANPFSIGCGQSDPILVGSNTYGIPPSSHSSCVANVGLFVAKIAPDSKPQISLSKFLPFLYLHNVGTADLNISSLTFSGGLAKAGGTCGNKVPAGTTCILTLTDANGKLAQGSVTINSDASPASQTFTPYLDPTAVGGLVGDYLYVDVSQLHFRPQFAGTKSPAQTMRIWNAGITNMTLNSIRATPYLTETNDCKATLAPGAYCTAHVSWDTTVNYQSDMIGIAYDNNAEIDDFLLAQYLISPTSLMLSQTNPIPFGNETQGNSYLNRTITITNVSNAAVVPPQVSVSGDAAFSVVGNTCTASLSPQQSCVVGFAMDSNTSSGQHSANLDFTGALSASIQIWGVVVLPQGITPSTYQMEWKPVLLGSSSVQDLTLANNSSSAVNISGFSFMSTDYTESDNCTGTALTAGASCTVHVTFKPQALGARNDSMTINLGTSMNPLAISLSGQGRYSLSLSPSVIDFGAGNLVNTPSAPQQLTVTNQTAASIGYTLSVTGPFSANNQCANPITAHGTCMISMTYHPTAVQNDTGTLAISAAGATTSDSVSLYGTGTSGAVMSAPNDFTFADTLVGKSSSGSIAVSNTGKLALSKVAISLGGMNSSDFSFSGNQCSTIPTGGSCTVSATFTPSAFGPRSASLTITSDSSNSPRMIALTGLGVGQPNASLSSTTLDFGQLDQGTQSAASVLTLTNTGSGALTITSITSSKDYPETNTCGASLAASASCQISIQFTPSQVGAETGTLTVTDNAPTGTQSVNLSGAGTAPSVSVETASGGSLTTTVARGQPATYSLALTGSAGFSGTVALACSGAPQYAACALSSGSITATQGRTTAFSATVTTQTTTTSAAAGKTNLLAGAGMGVLAICLVMPRRSRKGVIHMAWCALALLGLGCVSACGGGSASSSPPLPLVNYTPAGTYHLTLTATSGSVTATQTLVLIVQ